jgi:hypothetical protein
MSSLLSIIVKPTMKVTEMNNTLKLSRSFSALTRDLKEDLGVKKTYHETGSNCHPSP